MTLRVRGELAQLTLSLRQLADDIDSGRLGRIDCCTLAVLGECPQVFSFGPHYEIPFAERLFRDALVKTAELLT